MNSADHAVSQEKPSDPLSKKIQLLVQTEEQITQLKTQLNRLYVEQSQLERDIASIRALSAPIKRVPMEILSIILVNVVSIRWWDGERTYVPENLVVEESIFRLMLVCKSWRDIVINTPQVWRTICVAASFHSGEDAFVWASRQQRYINSHLSRCKAASLDITIDFASISSGSYAANMRINKIFRDLPEAGSLDLSSMGMNRCNDIYEASCTKLVNLLCGKDDKNMPRWRSLDLRLPPDREFAKRLWRIFNRPMPLLEKFTVDMSMYYGDTIVAPRSPWRALPAVKQMKLRHGCTLDLVHPCPNLVQLEMISLISWKGIERLNQFTKLKELRILGEIYGEAPNFAFSIQLPSLISLQMPTKIPHNVIKAFHLTVLPTFILEDYREPVEPIPEADLFRVTQHMIFLTLDPEVDEESCEEDFYEETGFSDNSDSEREPEPESEPVEEQVEEHEIIAERLASLFTQLIMAHTIEVKPEILDIANEVAEKLKAEGYLQSLDRVISRSPNEQDDEI